MDNNKYEKQLTKVNGILNNGIKQFDKITADYKSCLEKLVNGIKSGDEKTATGIFLTDSAKVISELQKNSKEESVFSSAYQILSEIYGECKITNDNEKIQDLKKTLKDNVYKYLNMIGDSIEEMSTNLSDGEVFKKEVKDVNDIFVDYCKTWQNQSETFIGKCKKMTEINGNVVQMKIKVKDGIKLFGKTLENCVNSTITKYEAQGWEAVSVEELKGSSWNDSIFTAIINFFASIFGGKGNSHNRVAEITFEKEE